MEVNLEQKAKEILYQYWGVNYKIPIKINNKLKKTLGRYIFERKINGEIKPIKIELSKELINNATEEIILHILKHELCHFVLSLKTNNFLDGDLEFENELKRIKAPSSRMVKIQYKTFCSNCKKEFKCRNDKEAKRLLEENKKTICCLSNFAYEGISYFC